MKTLIILILLVLPIYNQVPYIQVQALQTFYNATNGQKWTNKDKWMSGADPCTWYGVSCTSTKDISTLSLNSNNLNGTIPNNINQLVSLSDIYWKYNYLSGFIDNLIPFLTNKGGAQKTLYINNNLLSGILPLSISNLMNTNNYNLNANYWWCPLPITSVASNLNCYPRPICCEYKNTNDELIYECSQSFNCTTYSFAKNTRKYDVDECNKCGMLPTSPTPTPTPVSPIQYECCLYQYSGTTDTKALCVPSTCPQIYGYKYLGNYTVPTCSDCSF